MNLRRKAKGSLRTLFCPVLYNRYGQIKLQNQVLKKFTKTAHFKYDLIFMHLKSKLEILISYAWLNNYRMKVSCNSEYNIY